MLNTTIIDNLQVGTVQLHVLMCMSISIFCIHTCMYNAYIFNSVSTTMYEIFEHSFTSWCIPVLLDPTDNHKRFSAAQQHRIKAKFSHLDYVHFHCILQHAYSHLWVLSVDVREKLHGQTPLQLSFWYHQTSP